MRRHDDPLSALVRGAVEPLGYEALGVEHLQRPGASGMLRVYIDHPNGITLDDCEAVSRQLSAVLDVEDPIAGQYDLEVSSPGLDRPLFTPEQMARHAGSRAKVKLAVKLAGRRRFEGLILAVTDDALQMQVDGETVSLPLEKIERARLVPEL